MRNSEGRSAMMFACQQLNVKAVELLVGKEVGIIDINGCSALMIAALEDICELQIYVVLES